MSTPIPTIAAPHDIDFMRAAVFAISKSRDLLVAGLFTAIGLAVSFAYMALFPVAATFAAFALMPA